MPASCKPAPVGGAPRGGEARGAAQGPRRRRTTGSPQGQAKRPPGLIIAFVQFPDSDTTTAAGRIGNPGTPATSDATGRHAIRDSRGAFSANGETPPPEACEAPSQSVQP